MNREKLIPTALFGGAILIFLCGLSSIEIIQIDTRFGLFVREMNFASILNPYPFLYGEAYCDYSSLPVYLMFLAGKLTGSVSQLSLALPSALGCALLVVVTYRIGQKMLSVRFGVMGALFTLCSLEFISMARVASIDVYPALLAAVAFEHTFFACRDRRGMRYWLLFLLLIAGYFFRGPIGTVIVGAAVIAAALPFGDVKQLLRLSVTAALALLAAMAAYFVWTAAVFSPGFFGQVLYDQLFGRMSSSRWFGYYFWNGAGSYAITLPLALIALGGYYYRYRMKLFQRSENIDRIAFQALAVYFLLIIVGMSIPGTKHLRYIVGVLPPAGLLAAYVMVNPQELYFFVRLRRLFFVLARWLPAAVLLALIGFQAILLYSSWLKVYLPEPLLPDGIFLALPLLLLLTLVNLRNKNEIFNLAGVAVSFAVIHLMTVEPVEQSLQRTAISVGDFETVRPADKVLYFYALGPDGDENKYMLHVKDAQWFIPCYTRTVDEIAKLLKKNPASNLERTVPLEDLPPGSYVMARVDRWQKLPESLTGGYDGKLAGKIGNRNVLMLVKSR